MIVAPQAALAAKETRSSTHAAQSRVLGAGIIAAALWGSLCGPLQAEGLSGSVGGFDLSVSGFGTFGDVVTNTDSARFVRNGQLAGASKSASAKVDSNLGVQFTARANSWLSATVQVLDEVPLGSSQLTANVEWAFLKIEPVKNLSIKLGRFLAPVFLISDTRNINYANTWVRPPNEVYALAGVGIVDGGEATYRIPIGASHLAVTAYTGNGVISQTPNVNVYDVHGGELRWDFDWITLRAGYDTERHLISAAHIDDQYTFSGLGVIVDRNNIVLQLEAVSRRSESYASVVNANGWYALGGYRFGKLLPYAYHAQTTRVNPINPYYNLSYGQETTAIGLRWDAFGSADLKFQFERVDPKGTPGISFANGGVYPSVAPGLGSKAVNVVSLALDFVF
jgi:hypothetical protein